MRYDAVTIGNHEFDYGPVGPLAIPGAPTDDRRGALLALTKSAPFPFLSSNILERSSGRRVDWPNVPPSLVKDVAGVKVGLIGISTFETLETTIRPNVDDLVMRPLADAVIEQASRVRAEGAQLVVVLAHAGGKCKAYTGDVAADGCETGSEIFELARALPKDTVHAIVAGHSHAGVAHEVAGVAIIEQLAYGVAFGRVDFSVAPGAPPKLVKVFAPSELCPGVKQPDFETCVPGTYEGGEVVRDAEVARVLAPAIERSRARREEKLGPELPVEVKRSYDTESPLGNLFADLMRDATKVDVAFMNGGGLRANLPAGALTYGALFEAFPFDNRLATAKLTVAELERVVANNLQRSTGLLSISGLEVSAACKSGKLDVSLRRPGAKKPLADDVKVTLVASDFLFLGGDGFWGEVKDPKFEVDETLMRDAMEVELKKLPKVDATKLFDAKKPRYALPKARPIDCTPPRAP
jgi:5'-nucleotidase